MKEEYLEKSFNDLKSAREFLNSCELVDPKDIWISMYHLRPETQEERAERLLLEEGRKVISDLKQKFLEMNKKVKDIFIHYKGSFYSKNFLHEVKAFDTSDPSPEPFFISSWKNPTNLNKIINEVKDAIRRRKQL